MADRIDKMDHLDSWRVQASEETQKDREHQEENQDQQEERDAYDSLHDKTDWKLLFDKSLLWKKNIQIPKDEINEIIFRKINLKTDPSLLRIDIFLKSGEKISPAFVAISRVKGLRMKLLKSGDPAPEDMLYKDNNLRITIPANPEIFADEIKKNQMHKQTKPPLKKAAKATQKTETKKTVVAPSTLSVFKAREPDTGHWRPEVLMIYATVALVVALIVVGYFLLF